MGKGSFFWEKKIYHDAGGALPRTDPFGFGCFTRWLLHPVEGAENDAVQDPGNLCPYFRLYLDQQTNHKENQHESQQYHSNFTKDLNENYIIS